MEALKAEYVSRLSEVKNTIRNLDYILQNAQHQTLLDNAKLRLRLELADYRQILEEGEKLNLN